MTALTQYKKAVQEADEALKQIRNSGASEGTQRCLLPEKLFYL